MGGEIGGVGVCSRREEDAVIVSGSRTPSHLPTSCPPLRTHPYALRAVFRSSAGSHVRRIILTAVKPPLKRSPSYNFPSIPWILMLKKRLLALFIFFSCGVLSQALGSLRPRNSLSGPRADCSDRRRGKRPLVVLSNRKDSAAPRTNLSLSFAAPAELKSSEVTLTDQNILVLLR